MKAEEFRSHLTDDLIPFWNKMKDEEHGGFYGFADSNAVPDKTADKGLILCCRILWFYSSAYLLLKDPELLENAEHAYRFLTAHFFDEQYGGVYWSVTFDGKVSDDTKFTYAQAYAIYALSAFSRAAKLSADADGSLTKEPVSDLKTTLTAGTSNAETALELALKVYDVIETNCRDERGYFDAYYRDFSPKENDKLSENGVIAERTMNSSLHVLESYTELYKACLEHATTSISGSDFSADTKEAGSASAVFPHTSQAGTGFLQFHLQTKTAEVEQSIRNVLQLFNEKIYDPEKQICGVFFDSDFHSILDLDSYGHDIEAAWLIDHAATVLGDAPFRAALLPMINGLAESVLTHGMDISVAVPSESKKALEVKCAALNNECERSVVDTQKIWWVQAEAVIGFYNAYQNQPEQTEFLHQAEAVWNYIQTYVIDKKTGEWFESLPADNLPAPNQPLVHAWKCPYHNGRMCMEMIERLSR